MGMGKIVHLEGTQAYPDLDTLLGGYFHQDYTIDGNTLEEVVAAYKTDAIGEPEAIGRVRADIARFTAERTDDKKLDEDFEHMFMPGILPEGWEPDITNWRQWLTRVSELLNVGIQPGQSKRP